jgi:hypothetical protein
LRHALVYTRNEVVMATGGFYVSEMCTVDVRMFESMWIIMNWCGMDKGLSSKGCVTVCCTRSSGLSLPGWLIAHAVGSNEDGNMTFISRK